MRFPMKGLAASLLLAFATNSYALPVNGVVAAGGASIASSAGSMTINQSSQNVAINWQSFSIGATEAVRFVQPNSNSVALNRVLGSDPSSILGSLSANGKVFLVNPNGVLFAKGAQVNVGGLVASTRGISDTDFMAGNYKFAGTGGGTVVNQGTINADGGYVALLGANVSNEGVITARLGTVALAAGNAMTLDVAGDGLLNVVVNQGAVNALAQNGGLIQADGGQVLLTALSASSLLQSAVNNTGIIQAQTAENRNGTIRLLGDMQSGTVSVSGTLDVSGTGAGQTGGTVMVTGQHVGLFGGHINASGDAGGGTVLVGGGYQGNNPALQNASATYMSADSTINADAITNGNGGTAGVWSNDSTRAYGSITARGGAQGGNGGLIETSGHWLDVWGINVNTTAPNGKRGLWLLDPADVDITAATTFGAYNAANPNVFSPNPGVGVSTVDVGLLVTNLGATDVTISTTNAGGVPGIPPSGRGDITVSSAIVWVGPPDTTLRLNAAGDVNINARITATRGNLVVCCGRDVNVNARITTVNGSVLLSAGRDVNIERSANTILLLDKNQAGIRTTTGNIELCAGRDVVLNNLADNAALITLSGGNATLGQDLRGFGVPLGLTLRAGGAATGPGPAGGTVNIIGGGNAAINTGTYITATVGGPGTPIQIFYNPINYATPTPYSTSFNGTAAVGVTNFMLVYPDVLPKVADGTTTATLAGFKSTLISGPVPAGITLVPGPLAAANFSDATAGTGKTVTYSDFSVGGFVATPGDASLNFALPTTTCCGPRIGTTTGDITGGSTTATSTPFQALPFFPAGLPLLATSDIAVLGGITMPPIAVVEAPVETRAVALVPEEVPVVVPQVLPRRPDRN